MRWHGGQLYLSAENDLTAELKLAEGNTRNDEPCPGIESRYQRLHDGGVFGALMWMR